MNREINNGVSYCAIILTAERMGYKPAYVEFAKQAIKNGGDLEPIMIGRFSGEAVRIYDLIAKDKRHEEANKIAISILSEHGY